MLLMLHKRVQYAKETTFLIATYYSSEIKNKLTAIVFIELHVTTLPTKRYVQKYVSIAPACCLQGNNVTS